MICRVLLLLLVALPIFAKSLHWSAVDVNARLDADGRLHVVERQQIVFDGDWNGGERDFDLRPGQSLRVNGMARIEDGREIPMKRGTLDEIDGYDLVGGDVLRWRSRLPSDAPFENREIAYVLDVTFSDILTPNGETFLLSHDFGLPDRQGVIERFTLNLAFDPVWNQQDVQETRTSLEPGRSVIVHADLTRTGAGWPAGVTRPLAWWVGPAAVAFFAACAALLIRGFIRDEREVGRFAPLPAQVDPELLKLKPELAGAIWDAGVGPPEVAALLARMSQEGKITTRVEGETLHLKLNVDLNTLTRHESVLAWKLFITDETDTTRIREHYKRTGFDPAALIRPGIESTLAETIPQWTARVRRFNPWLHVATIPAALLFVIAATVLSPAPGPILLAVFPGTVFAIIACVVAWFMSRQITGFARAFVAPSLLMSLPSLAFIGVALTAKDSRIGVILPFAIALWLLALLHLMLNLLKIRDPRELIAFRKRIAGARKFFLEQLQLPQPALRDEWFPYVLAFGLGTQVDQWFRAFGGTASASSSGSAWSSSTSSTSSTSSSSWTGGGGAFGGAGATGSWAVAAGAVAAGVSAPSSSGGGGGGGGGGSSSGGGGGGGW